MISSSLRVFLATFLASAFCTLSAVGQVEDNRSDNSLLYYSGTFDNFEKLEFNLQLKGYSVSGSYIIVDSGDMYVFNGRVSADKGGMGIVIFNSNNEYAGSMEATFLSTEADFAREIKGLWKQPSGKANKKMAIRKVAELAHEPASGYEFSGYGE